MYDAYIEKEDLFGKTGEMKVIYTPRVSSAGNIVTEEQEKQKNLAGGEGSDEICNV